MIFSIELLREAAYYVLQLSVTALYTYGLLLIQLEQLLGCDSDQGAALAGKLPFDLRVGFRNIVRDLPWATNPLALNHKRNTLELKFCVVESQDRNSRSSDLSCYL